MSSKEEESAVKVLAIDPLVILKYWVLRLSQGKTDDFFPDILIVAGLKKTPPLSSGADALQPGEWGVDVVETQSAESFLMAMGWEEKTAGKTIEDVFKVERRKG
ncbi:MULTISPECIES: DUF2656 family protein [unclassified Microcoleus]|uniref:DUF2656 family protein n=1 Tax=unclassified Microcoleus TaxID=2642155 RepID=UPI002FD32795